MTLIEGGVLISSLRLLCVLCVSAVMLRVESFYRGDAENAEEARRRNRTLLS